MPDCGETKSAWGVELVYAVCTHQNPERPCVAFEDKGRVWPFRFLVTYSRNLGGARVPQVVAMVWRGGSTFDLPFFSLQYTLHTASYTLHTPYYTLHTTHYILQLTR